MARGSVEFVHDLHTAAVMYYESITGLNNEFPRKTNGVVTVWQNTWNRGPRDQKTT